MNVVGIVALILVCAFLIYEVISMVKIIKKKRLDNSIAVADADCPTVTDEIIDKEDNGNACNNN